MLLVITVMDGCMLKTSS